MYIYEHPFCSQTHNCLHDKGPGSIGTQQGKALRRGSIQDIIPKSRCASSIRTCLMLWESCFQHVTRKQKHHLMYRGWTRPSILPSLLQIFADLGTL